MPELIEEPRVVAVHTVPSPWDASLKRLGAAFHERLPSLLPGREPRLGLGTAVTVRIAALGLADAYRDLAGETGRNPAADGTDPVVPIWLHGSIGLVGPYWAPGVGSTGPCPTCVERRWQAIRPRDERHALEHDGVLHPVGPLPHLTPFAVEALWLLFLRACQEHPSRAGIGRGYQLRMDTLQVTMVEVLADSECPRCASPRPDTASAAVIALRERVKPTPTSYRMRPTSALPLPVGALVNPITGALGTTALRDYHPSATAPVTGNLLVRSRYGLHDMWWSGHAGSYAASESYALLEGLERYAGQYPRAKRTTVFDSYANLAPRALDPSGLGYHPAFYEGHCRHHAPYSPSTPMHWVWGYSLRDREPRLVPEQLVYYLDRRPDERKFVRECSNGCASGSCPEEALLHGLLELIERDAFLLAWYGSARLAEIDPAGCQDPRLRFMLDRVGLFGYDIRLFDTRVDLPVPVVTAVAVRRDAGIGQLCFAAGASLDPDDAIRAAVCETASYVSGFDERVAASAPQLYEMVADYTKVTELTHHALLYGLPEMARHAAFLLDEPPLRSPAELYASWLTTRPDTMDLLGDLEFVTGLVAGLGGDVVAVDQTCPEQELAGVHTMAVIAPALVPIDFGWQRQRALHCDRLSRFLAKGGHGPDRLGATARNPHPHPFP